MTGVQTCALPISVYKDGMVLDGIASASDDDEVAREYVFGKEEAKVDQSAKNRNDFLSAFLEAAPSRHPRPARTCRR